MHYGQIAALAARAPLPTAAPSLEALNLRLGLRDAGAGITCGWATSINGTNSFPLTCMSTEVCAFNSNLAVSGCCLDDGSGNPASGCALQTSCMDYSMYAAASISTFPSFVGGCTNQRYPYCEDVLFVNTYSSFLCGVTATNFGGLEGSDPPTAPSSTSTLTSTSSNPTPTDFNNNASPTLTFTPTPTPAPTSSSPLTTGAIVAIAIAGTVVIVAVLVLIYLIRRSKQKRAAAELSRVNILENEIRQSKSQSTGRWAADAQDQPGTAVTEDMSTVEGTAYPVRSPLV